MQSQKAQQMGKRGRRVRQNAVLERFLSESPGRLLEMLWNFVLFALAIVSVSAQLTTITDPNNGGATEVMSMSTDGNGVVYSSIISTITSTTTTATTTTTTPSVPPPTQTGTAAPPFSSFVVSSGTIINYSDYTKTAEPSTATSSSGAAGPRVVPPPLAVPAALIGGVGIALAMM